MAWFPVLPPDQQSPYDPGPYVKAARSRSIAAPGTSTTDRGGPPAAHESPAAVPAPAPEAAPPSSSARGSRLRATEATAASALLAEVNALPAGLPRTPLSGQQRVGGQRPGVSGGKSMLAGDPHLPQTVPSVPYQVALSAPGTSSPGSASPGLPSVLIGHNDHMLGHSPTRRTRPRCFTPSGPVRASRASTSGRRVAADAAGALPIPVRGGAVERLTVNITVHGPVMTQAGQTTSVDWMGNVPSPDLSVILGIGRRATSRSSARRWPFPPGAIAELRLRR